MQHSDDKRRDRLNALHKRLQAGKHVQNRDLETWLTDDEFAAYLAEVGDQRALRSDVEEKPEQIVRYEQLFQQARLMENRAEGYSTRGNFKQAKIFRAKADAAYERLLEHYNEILAGDFSLTEWFDRSVDFDPENAPSLVAECMPQVITSRSLNNASQPMNRRLMVSRNEIKLRAVEAAIFALDAEPIAEQELDAKSAALLSGFLKMSEN